MTAGQKLRAIRNLTMQDGLSYEDYHDVGHWVETCRDSDYDTTLLSEKSVERIGVIFARFFQEK